MSEKLLIIYNFREFLIIFILFNFYNKLLLLVFDYNYSYVREKYFAVLLINIVIKWL